MSYYSGFDEQTLVFPEEFTFKQRVLGYHDVYQNLIDAWERVEDELESAEQANSLARYKDALSEYDRLEVLILPFVAAHKEAKRLAAAGYKLADFEGNLTPQPSNTEVDGGIIDAIVALFMIYIKAAVDDIVNSLTEKIEDSLEDPSLTDILTLASGAILLQALADKWFRSGDNSELAQFMRDPIRRPEQILRSWRDNLLDRNSGNIFSRTVGRPVREVVRAGERIDKEGRRWIKKLGL